ncbi:hypothetical protein PIB30_087329 [Stylosanthes scabra]|uniref:Uncharacterized protein n=1 Tax=Stylosanthes scabra TaxID=79078 RepID=A0ABU6SUV8_9FABA|nr:hypothetical protein [Stylosanthes scabra]
MGSRGDTRGTGRETIFVVQSRVVVGVGVEANQVRINHTLEVSDVCMKAFVPALNVTYLPLKLCIFQLNRRHLVVVEVVQVLADLVQNLCNHGRGGIFERKVLVPQESTRSGYPRSTSVARTTMKKRISSGQSLSFEDEKVARKPYSFQSVRTKKETDIVHHKKTISLAHVTKLSPTTRSLKTMIIPTNKHGPNIKDQRRRSWLDLVNIIKETQNGNGRAHGDDNGGGGGGGGDGDGGGDDDNTIPSFDDISSSEDDHASQGSDNDNHDRTPTVRTTTHVSNTVTTRSTRPADNRILSLMKLWPSECHQILLCQLL